MLPPPSHPADEEQELSAEEIEAIHKSRCGVFIKYFDPVNLVFIMMCGAVGSCLAVLMNSYLLQTIFIPIPTFLDFFIVRLPSLLQGNWKADRHINVVSGGIFCCFVADFFLAIAWISDSFFYYGMAFYGAGHIFFIVGFSILGEKLKIKRLFPLILFVGGMVMYLCFNCAVFDNPTFGIAVVVYAGLEMTMCWRALARIGFQHGEENKKSQWTVGIGAVLYLMSDLLLLSRKTCSDFDQAIVFQIFYFILYCAGLLGIAFGSAHKYSHPTAMFPILGQQLIYSKIKKEKNGANHQ